MVFNSLVTRSGSKQQIRNVARAYLFYILGCTLFTDKSGTRVHVMYLMVLMNFDETRTYAWGVVALTYLYRHLGFVTRASVNQIAGYLTLLWASIYEHYRLNPNLHIRRTCLNCIVGFPIGSLETICQIYSRNGRRLIDWALMRR